MTSYAEENVAGREALERHVLDVGVAEHTREVAAVASRPRRSIAGMDATLVEQRREIDAGPAYVGDAPRRHLRLDWAAAALVHGLDGLARSRLEIIEAQLDGLVHEAVDDERPSLGINRGNAKMGQDEEILGPRHGVDHLVWLELIRRMPFVLMPARSCARAVATIGGHGDELSRTSGD